MFTRILTRFDVTAVIVGGPFRSVFMTALIGLSGAGCGSSGNEPPNDPAPQGTGGSPTAGTGGSPTAGTGGSPTAGTGSPTGGAASTAGATAGGASGSGGAANQVGAGGAEAGTAGVDSSGGADATGGSSGGTGGSGGAGGRAGVSGGNSTGSGSAVNAGTKDITVWLAGDSTVADGSAPCAGWGKNFKAEFNEHVTVKNRAQGGATVQTWLHDVSNQMVNGECRLNSESYLPRWQEMLDGMKEGHALLIQFGINDSASTCNRHVGTDLFKSYLGMMAKAARERKANPIFITPVSSISCNGGTAVGSRGRYATATREAGTEYDVPVIDLEQLSVTLYNKLGFCPLPGPDNASTFQSGTIGAFFCNDHTHFEAAGALQIGGLVAQALKDQRLNLGAYVVE